MSQTFIKDLKMYERRGKYFFSIYYKNSNDNAGWQTVKKEFSTERERKDYVSSFYETEDYVPVPYSYYDKVLKKTRAISDKTTQTNRFYMILKEGVSVYKLKKPHFNYDNLYLSVKTYYSPKFREYSIRFYVEDTSTTKDRNLFTREEIDNLVRKNPVLVRDFQEVLYREGYKG